MNRLTLAAAALVLAGACAHAQNLARVGGKTIALATMETDKKCSQVVAPFELTTNLAGLAQATAKRGIEQIPEFLKNFPGLPNRGTAAPSLNTMDMKKAAREEAIRMNWLPLSLELEYGKHLLEEQQAGGTILDRSRDRGKQYPIVDAMLAKLMAVVNETHPYTFQVFIRRESNGNAQALPGGILLIDTDLVARPEKHNQALLTLAHEVGHVLQRHETRAMQARVFDALAVAGLGVPEIARTLSDLQQSQDKVLGLLVSSKLQFERHTVAQELQADACAVRLSQRAFDDDSRLLSAIEDFIRNLPPPEAGDVAGQRAGKPTLEKAQEVLGRDTNRHPTAHERFNFFRSILGDLVAGGIKAVPMRPPPKPERVPAPGPAKKQN